jgi:hypothetical protein
MTNEQRVMIATGAAAGVDPKKISDTIGVPEQDVKIFLAWWHDLGKPDLTS